MTLISNPKNKMNNIYKQTALGNARAALETYKEHLAAIPAIKAKIREARASGEIPADHKDPMAEWFGEPTVEQYIDGLNADLESREKCVAGFEDILVELLFGRELEKQES